MAEATVEVTAVTAVEEVTDMVAAVVTVVVAVTVNRKLDIRSSLSIWVRMTASILAR